MRSFIFAFVAVSIVVVGSVERKIAKRESLVQRFTSNPFFLRHFSGTGDYHGYEITRSRFLINSGNNKIGLGYNFLERNNQEESHQQKISNFDSNQVEETTIKNDQSVFKSLPYYETNTVFRVLEKPQFHLNKGHDLRFVKEPQVIFKKIEEPEVVVPKQPQVIFGEVEESEPQIIFRDVEEPSKNIPLTYYYRNLPHFDIKEKFSNVQTFKARPVTIEKVPPKQPQIIFKKTEAAEEFLSKQHQTTEEPERVVPKRPQIIFKEIEESKQPQVIFRKIEETTEIPVTYRNLPHFEFKQKFLEASVSPAVTEKPRRVVLVVKKKKLHTEDAPNFSETEFGRRIRPIVKPTIADLPLEDNSLDVSRSLVNSYGHSLVGSP